MARAEWYLVYGLEECFFLVMLWCKIWVVWDSLVSWGLVTFLVNIQNTVRNVGVSCVEI